MNNQQISQAYCIQMANTIWKSIFCSVTPEITLSWGIQKLSATSYQNMAGLTFKVNGMLHKGRVIITYDEGADYFIVHLMNNDNVCIKKRNDVCFDELGCILDEEIEKPRNMSAEEYSHKSWEESINNLCNS